MAHDAPGLDQLRVGHASRARGAEGVGNQVSAARRDGRAESFARLRAGVLTGEGGAVRVVDDKVVEVPARGGRSRLGDAALRVDDRAQFVELVDQDREIAVVGEYPAPGILRLVGHQRRVAARGLLVLDHADLLDGRSALADVHSAVAEPAQLGNPLLQEQVEASRELLGQQLDFVGVVAGVDGHDECPVRTIEPVVQTSALSFARDRIAPFTVQCSGGRTGSQAGNFAGT